MSRPSNERRSSLVLQVAPVRPPASGRRGAWSADTDLEAIRQNVKRASQPSKLQITDLRVAVVEKAPMTCPMIRIDTNQGIVGWGEVRDGASETYALVLKSRLLGENPCNVDRMFRKIKQFGGHARQAGGVSRGDGAAWTSPARRGPCRRGRCSAASSAIACGCTPTRPTAHDPRSRAAGSRSAWTVASRI